MSVRDEKTGIFKKDMRILHIKILDTGTPVTGPECDAIAVQLGEGLKAKGLDKEYIVAVTGPDVEINIRSVESLIQELQEESDFLKKAITIDTIIAALKAARDKKWRQEPPGPQPTGAIP
jgi:hypothetical protein